MRHAFRLRAIVLSLAAVASAISGPAVAAPSDPSNPSVSFCAASALTLSLSGTDGEFSGMSHDGFRATVTNHSDVACALARRPAFTFRDAAHRPVAIVIQPYPGVPYARRPVLYPVTVEPGESASAIVRYVSEDAYETKNCLDASEVAFAPARPELVVLTVPVRVHACGPAAPAPIVYELSNWQIVTATPGPDATATARS